jgi:hypothetical protein
MVWSAVADNQAISYQTLKDACDALIFLQIGSIPAPGKTLSQMVTAELIQSRVEIESSYLSGVPNNELVVKSQVVPVTRTYYRLTPCGSGGTVYTRIFPTLTSQQYINYSTGEKFYHDGTSVGPQTNIPSGYNGSIQRVDGKTFCAA